MLKIKIKTNKWWQKNHRFIGVFCYVKGSGGFRAYKFVPEFASCELRKIIHALAVRDHWYQISFSNTYVNAIQKAHEWAEILFGRDILLRLLSLSRHHMVRTSFRLGYNGSTNNITAKQFLERQNGNFISA